MSGSEIVVILVLGLIVLGPEKLPDAIRRFGKVYSQIRQVSSGFQNEFKTAFDEPLQELKQTAKMAQDAVKKLLPEVDLNAPHADPDIRTELPGAAAEKSDESPQAHEQ